MSTDRKIPGYWWTWAAGEEWPSWYYGEATAREAARRIARGSPGRKVSVGKLVIDETIMLPDNLEVVASS